MERGETIVHRMTVVFPLQLEKGSKALEFEVAPRRSLSLRLWVSIFELRPNGRSPQGEACKEVGFGSR